jgi:hypothetical protein
MFEIKQKYSAFCQHNSPYFISLGNHEISVLQFILKICGEEETSSIDPMIWRIRYFLFSKVPDASSLQLSRDHWSERLFQILLSRDDSWAKFRR